MLRKFTIRFNGIYFQKFKTLNVTDILNVFDEKKMLSSWLNNEYIS